MKNHKASILALIATFTSLCFFSCQKTEDSDSSDTMQITDDRSLESTARNVILLAQQGDIIESKQIWDPRLFLGDTMTQRRGYYYRGERFSRDISSSKEACKALGGIKKISVSEQRKILGTGGVVETWVDLAIVFGNSEEIAGECKLVEIDGSWYASDFSGLLRKAQALSNN